MKPLLLYAALAISVITASATFAQTALVPGEQLAVRTHQISRALRRNVRSHILTPDQFRRCMRLLDRIRSEENTMRAQNGGGLTDEQFRDLNLRLNQLDNWARGMALSDIPQ